MFLIKASLWVRYYYNENIIPYRRTIKMPRRSIIETQASRERLLKSAARLMREKGYDGVGIDAITANAQLTPGAFYTHFASKLALFEAVVTVAIDQAEKFLPPIETESDIDTFVAFYLSDTAVRELGTGCIVAAMSNDLTRQGECVRKAAAAYVELIQLRIAKALSPRLGADAQTQAWKIVAQVMGSLIVARIVKNKDVTRLLKRRGLQN
jgi:TetR/AcrR family transcriptional regulator, transcriptional repressor for nem operon